MYFRRSSTMDLRNTSFFKTISDRLGFGTATNWLDLDNDIISHAVDNAIYNHNKFHHPPTIINRPNRPIIDPYFVPFSDHIVNSYEAGLADGLLYPL